MTRERRPKGQGSVYQDKYGRWWAKLSPDDQGRTPKRRAQSESDAWKLLDRLKHDRKQQLNVSGTLPTVERYAAQWLEHKKKTLKPTVCEDYESIIRIAITPVFGKQRLNRPTMDTIQAWVDDLAEHLARNTVRNRFRVLRNIFKRAVIVRLIPYNPTDGVELPKNSDETVKAVALTFDEVGRLLDAAADHRLYALYVLAIGTGMRQGELLGLRWPSVHLDGEKPFLLVREQLQLVENKPVFLAPKSKKSRRDIPLDADMVQLLRELWQRQQEERCDPKWHEHGLVFPATNGSPLERRNLMRHFRDIRARARLPAIRFHDLRHTAGSLMLANRVELVDVSEILGHSSVLVTAQVYAHSYEENKRNAVAGVMARVQRVRGENQ